MTCRCLRRTSSQGLRLSPPGASGMLSASAVQRADVCVTIDRHSDFPPVASHLSLSLLLLMVVINWAPERYTFSQVRIPSLETVIPRLYVERPKTNHRLLGGRNVQLVQLTFTQRDS